MAGKKIPHGVDEGGWCQSRTLSGGRPAGWLVVTPLSGRVVLAVALSVVLRGQRSTEQTMIHTEENARERRITELYTKAVEQLGSDKAPVRLGGLYALE